MTFTKSWLQKQITDLEATRDEIPFGLDEDGNNTLAALKLALAGMEAEPVAVLPADLHPDTKKLVTDFCMALAEKLYNAQLKYGYDADWKQDGWPTQCQAHFHQHIAKGDPRDVAAYCAFMWYHGWKTSAMQDSEANESGYRAIVERISEIVHGKVTDIDLLSVTVKSMKDKLLAAPQQEVKP